MARLMRVSMDPRRGQASGGNRRPGTSSCPSHPTAASYVGGGVGTAGGPASGADPQALQTQLLMEMLSQLREKRGGGTGDTGDLDAPDGQDLDGVRVLRTLSRMRALKAQLCQEPAKVCRDYQQRWEDELVAA